ncbi:hypothetical protein WDU94_010592 [Cyamophila willieti]
MSPIRELFLILSVLAIANASRNNVDLVIELLKPFNQQDFQKISWRYLTGLEQDWENLQIPLSGAADSEISNFLSNVNKGYDNFGRSTDNLVRMCRTFKSMLPSVEHQNKLKEYNEQVARQLNSFKQATDKLRDVLTNLEAGANNLNSVDIEAENSGFTKYTIQDYNNGTVKLEVDTGYANAELSELLSFLAVAPTHNTDNTFNVFENKFNGVEKGVNSAATIIRDLIHKEENIGENYNNEGVPTVAQLHTLSAECDQFLNWKIQ